MILISGQIEALNTRKDKTIKITIGTQEMNPNEFAELFSLNQQFAYIGIKPEPFINNEIEIIESLKTEYDELKSPAQRLRGILYRIFEQNPDGFKDFNSYYIHKMEKLCDHFKNQLV